MSDGGGGGGAGPVAGAAGAAQGSAGGSAPDGEVRAEAGARSGSAGGDGGAGAGARAGSARGSAGGSAPDGEVTAEAGTRSGNAGGDGAVGGGARSGAAGAAGAAPSVGGADGNAHEGAASGGRQPVDPARSTAPARKHAGGKRTGIRRVTGSFWFNLVAAFVVLALVQAFVVKLYYVPSGSMQQTLAVGDRILVDRISYEFGANPKPGDVVVFTASSLWGEPAPAPSNPLSYAVKWLSGIVGVGPSLDHTLVKRVIAGPGQTVSCCDALGRVTVDGVALDEPYIYEDYPYQPGVLDCTTTPESQRCFPTVTVPAGQYFVLGDHRSNSNDSIYACRGRPPTASTSDCLKMVGRSDVVGRAFAVVLPPGHWSGL